MNKRVMQLLLKVVSMEGEDGELPPSLHTPDQIEKFAELIVRECATIARTQQNWNDRNLLQVNIDNCIILDMGFELNE